MPGPTAPRKFSRPRTMTRCSQAARPRTSRRTAETGARECDAKISPCARRRKLPLVVSDPQRICPDDFGIRRTRLTSSGRSSPRTKLRRSQTQDASPPRVGIRSSINRSSSSSFAQANMGYRWFEELGGRRTPAPDSVNTAWRNTSFRGYADYMATEEFAAAFSELLKFGRASPYRGDVRGVGVVELSSRADLARPRLSRIEVLHILDEKQTKVRSVHGGRQHRGWATVV